MRYIAIIPARFASTRFPGKPLAPLAGKPVVQHVYERVSEVFAEVYVATDDERIFQAVEGFRGHAVLTRGDHRSGTDRCFEAYQKVCAGPSVDSTTQTVVVNVQGDEPFIAAAQLEAIKGCFADAAVDIATLVKPFPADTPFPVLENPNTPKVVLDDRGYAMCFSRSVIPYLRGVPREQWPARHRYLKHIGLYAYRTSVLEQITQLPPGDLEQCESLEQLRWLQAGFRIKVAETDLDTVGIDTPGDLLAAERLLAGK